MNASSLSNSTTNEELSYWRKWTTSWDRFWFQPTDPATLGLIRLFTGLIVFYSMLVWSRELLTFFGDNGVLRPEYRSLLLGQSAWSHFDWLHSHNAIWIAHVLAMLIVGLFTLGCWTRVTAVLTALLVISYANRATGALFGLDQIMAFLCLYLAIGNSGGAFSIDQWRRRRAARKSGHEVQNLADVSTNIAIRLIQLHLCLVYLFAGLGKLQGDTWWNGQAIWYSVASYEYQTLDLTWMSDWMWLVSLITLATIIWEVGYVALIWSKLTRPLMLAMAVFTHLGIGVAMGMMTFGLIMLVANIAFIEPQIIRRWKLM
jgi:hypothetical protein